MTERLGRAVDALFWLAAVAWPLDLLQYVPGLDVSLLALIALVLLPMLVIDATAQQKLRVPFEVLAPATIIAGLMGVDAALGVPSETFGEVLAAVIVLISLAHFAPTRDSIRRYLFVSVVSGFAVTLWTLFSGLLDFTPTAFSERTGVTFAFAYSVPSAVHILLLVSCVAIYVAREHSYPPPARAAATGALIFAACALVGSGVYWALDTKSLPVASFPPIDPLRLGALGLALWLAARILGKVAVDAHTAYDRIHSLWFTAAIVTLLVVACSPVAPGGYQGYLAGLACASVLPARLDPPRAIAAPLIALIPAILAAVNLTTVFPGNTRDQRQYDEASRRDFESGNYARLLARLDTIESHAPAERRTHLWRARTALALGLPNWASFEFIEAVTPASGRLLLAAPSDGERKDFVVQMRDVVADMAEERSVCAFERTLLAQGDRDAALYSLRLETAVPLTHVESNNPVPFASAVAFIVGDASIVDELGFWSPDELITLLTYWGATTAVSDEIPDEPFIIVAQRTPYALGILVYRDGLSETLNLALDAPSPDDAETLRSAGSLRWLRPGVEDQYEHYSLALTSASGEVEVGRLSLTGNRTPTFTWTESTVDIPFTPAILLSASP